MLEVPEALPNQIRTERLLLLPFREEDEESLHRLWNNPEVRRYLWDGKPVSRETVADQIQKSEQGFSESGCGHFTIRRLEDPGNVMGFVGLGKIKDSDEVEILYALHPSHWQQGLATEAARAILRYGFNEVGLDEILAGADAPNSASFQVMERVGMSFFRDARIGDLPVRYYRLRKSDFEDT